MRSVIPGILGILGKIAIYATMVRERCANRRFSLGIPEKERMFPLRAIMTRGGAARRKVSSRKIYGGKVDARVALSLS